MRSKVGAAALFALGLVSLGYYALCIAYAHIGVSWLWLWPLLSVFCFVRGGMLLWEAKRKRHLFPRPVRIAWRALVCVGLACFTLAEAQIIAAMGQQPPDGLDVIIVLGAAVRGENPTSPMLLRMQRALDYLEANPDTRVIASGGQGSGESISEAECIRRYLVSNGIAEDRILLEDASRDTEENIRNSYALLEGENVSVGLVTSSFHVCRALLIARLEGHGEAVGVPAKALLPLGIHYTVREAFGLAEVLMRSLTGRYSAG